MIRIAPILAALLLAGCAAKQAARPVAAPKPAPRLPSRVSTIAPTVLPRPRPLPSPAKPTKLRELPYPGEAASPYPAEQYQKLAEELIELDPSTQRALSRKFVQMGHWGIPVLLNVFARLDLADEEGKIIGNYIASLLMQVSMREDAPIYNVMARSASGRNQCRKQWFVWWKARQQK